MGKIEPTPQMIGTIGEQLVCAHLLAHGWPTVNVNSTISNFKGFDLLCLDSSKYIGIQVKTTLKGSKSGFPIGINCEQAADREYLTKHITGPWVFVHVKELNPLDVDFYILTAKQMIDLVYGIHKLYLCGKKKSPKKNVKEMACLKIRHILGKQYKPKLSDTIFNNPMTGVETLNKWENIWVKE